MYIYCSWNYENDKVLVKFSDLPDTGKSLDFLQDCICEIALEYNRKLKLVYPVKDEIKDGTIGDFGSFN